jgi:hypothetical protein
VAVVADVVDVLRAKARLDVADAGARRVRRTEQVAQQRLHAATREKGGGIVVQHERRARDDRVTILDEHFQIRLTDPVRLHRRQPRTVLPVNVFGGGLRN